MTESLEPAPYQSLTCRSSAGPALYAPAIVVQCRAVLPRRIRRFPREHKAGSTLVSAARIVGVGRDGVVSGPAVRLTGQEAVAAAQEKRLLQ